MGWLMSLSRYGLRIFGSDEVYIDVVPVDAQAESILCASAPLRFERSGRENPGTYAFFTASSMLMTLTGLSAMTATSLRP
jgi:hypothetical protein